MSLTNPSKLINVQELAYFEGKVANKYAAKTALSTKADKVSGSGLNNHLAALNSNGNLKDSGIAVEDIKPYATISVCEDIIDELE